MTGFAAALATVAVAALPDSAAQRYRVELGGEHVGVAQLSIRCEPARCEVRWSSQLRAPADSGGGVLERDLAIATSRDGFAHHVRLVLRDPNGTRALESHAGPVPATIAETVLAAVHAGERRCIAVRDEQSGRKGDACARRDGDWLEGTVLGEPFRARVRAGALPEEVFEPGQRMRFVADARAALPASAPRLFGDEVRFDDAARPQLDAALAGEHPHLRFCGVPADPRPLEGDVDVPREWPDGANCREKTHRYLAAAQAAGINGRHVVGVAWDGHAFAWHEWAELQSGGRWIAVDPSFRQVPAQAPRFSLARYADGDEAARLAAGARILSCWGAARIEASPGAALPRQ